MNKSRIVWSAYTQAYESCLAAAGWTAVPLGAEKEAESRPAAAEIMADGRIHGFDLALKPPQGFVLQGREQKNIGPTRVASFCFAHPDGRTLRLDFQQADTVRFRSAEYPVPKAFICYDRGDFGAPDRLVWTVFCGRFNRVWVMGMGAYFRVDEKRRLSMTMTAPLTAQSGPPPSNLAITREQKQELDSFADTWKIWLREDLGE